MLVALSGCQVPDSGNARVAAARIQIRAFAQMLETYRVDTGEYPTDAQGLQALRVAPPGVKGWQGPYLPKAVPLDPWGNPYRYHESRSPGTRPEIASSGWPH
ncbi:MAG: type II secretion system protein GspG [Acidobacteriota bacterium]